MRKSYNCQQSFDSQFVACRLSKNSRCFLLSRCRLDSPGSRILDEVLSPLLLDLSSSERSEVALDGLRQVMAVKSRVVLPHIVPQLVRPPVNTRALSLLSSVAGGRGTMDDVITASLSVW